MSGWGEVALVVSACLMMLTLTSIAAVLFLDLAADLRRKNKR